MNDRYQGCLLALSCGDALGGPVEFRSREQIAADHPTGLRDFIGGGWLDLFPGEITDDTQMALAIAESLAERGDLDMADVSARFLAWYHSEPKDIGNTTRASLRNLAEGLPWDQAGARVAAANGDRAAGNGAVMRCAPVALRYRRTPDLLRQASADTSRVTHADRRCVAGAIAINQAIVHLLDGGGRETLIDAALAGIDDGDMRSAIAAAPGMRRSEVRAGGFVLETVSAAIWAFLNHDTLEEVVVAAVALGDDTDTTGAVAGALAGAHYGVTAIPERWLSKVQHRERLTELADRLLELSQASNG